MNKKDFQRRFGEKRDKYLGAKNIEQAINRYLSKYGYGIVSYIVNKILAKEKEKRNLENEIRVAERKLDELKASRT